MRHLPRSVGKPRASVPSLPAPACPALLLQPCTVTPMSPQGDAHKDRWQRALTFEEESLSPDLGHRIKVSVASVRHVPPDPAERCPGKHDPSGQQGPMSPWLATVPMTTSPLSPGPQQKTTGCVHLSFLTLKPSHVALTFPQRAWATLSLKTALWQTCSWATGDHCWESSEDTLYIYELA